MEKEKYLKRWAKQTGKTIEELEEIWEIAKERMERLGLGEDERAIMGAFRRRLRGVLFGTAKQQRKTEEFFGFVIGTSTLIDWEERMRQKALRHYNRDPNQAILDGLVDEAGNPLDNREFIFRFGKRIENPNFRKPLVGHSYERKVFGIAIKEDDNEPKVFRLNLYRKTALEFKNYKPFVPVRFLAKCRNDDPFYDLTPTRITKFQTQKDETIDFEKWIRSVSHVYSLDKIEQAYDASRDAIDNWVFIEADIDYINPDIDEERQQRTINLADDSVGLQTFKVRIPGDYPITFSEFSRVIVMGQVQKFKRQDGTDAYIIEGYGIFPIPGKTTKVPERESYPAEGEEREEPIILWE